MKRLIRSHSAKEAKYEWVVISAFISVYQLATKNVILYNILCSGIINNSIILLWTQTPFNTKKHTT